MNRLHLRAGLLALSTFLAYRASSAPTKFAPNTYVAISKAGMNSAAKTYYISTTSTPASASYTVGTPFTLPYNVNGAGLNANDSFLYAATYVGADNTIGNSLGVSLYRLGANGEYVDLGLLPTPGQNGLEFVNFSAGTMTANGSYYYITYGFTPTGMAKLANAQSTGNSPNLTTADINGYLCWLDNTQSLSANPGNSAAPAVSGYYQLNFSNPDINAALQSFLDQVNAAYPNIFDADGGVQDIDINPTDGLVYAYISYPQGGNTVGRPVVFNTPSAGVSAVTPVGTTVNTAPGQEVAGIMFDPGGTLYGLFTTGDYATINLSTGALNGMSMSNIPRSSDGNLRGDLAKAFVNTPLPVTLASFEGRAQEGTVLLNWKTSMEKDFKNFVVEYSADATDWSSLATVNAKAGTTQDLNGNEYAYTHTNPKTGANFYRLAMVDRDGTKNYSNTVVVNMESKTDAISIYPNPAGSTLYIQSASESIKGIMVYNMTGQQFALKMQSNTVDISTLVAGSYFIEILSEHGTASRIPFIKH